ncbi:7326_t:CDS:2 [Entrophospora sp. SA101]|nr:7326_t:CDS:2 [Entrophospora sp. SA101]
MSIATSNRCLNELAQIQDGGKLASLSRGALINDIYDDGYDDTELESFDQELHRRYNLMYFVPRSKFNKRDVEKTRKTIIIQTYLRFLSIEDRKEIETLINKNTHSESDGGGYDVELTRKPLFDYPKYLKELDFQVFVHKIVEWAGTKNKKLRNQDNYNDIISLIIDQLIRLFSRKSNNLDYLSYCASRSWSKAPNFEFLNDDDNNNSISSINNEGNVNFLINLTQFQFHIWNLNDDDDGNIVKFVNLVGSSSKKIRKLDISYGDDKEENITNSIIELIKKQRNLYDILIKRHSNNISSLIKALECQSNSLRSLSIKDAIFDIEDFKILSKFRNIYQLAMENCAPSSKDFKNSLADSNFSFKNLDFGFYKMDRDYYPKYQNEFIKSSGKNCKRLITNFFTVEIGNAIINHCDNIEEFKIIGILTPCYPIVIRVLNNFKNSLKKLSLRFDSNPMEEVNLINLLKNNLPLNLEYLRIVINNEGDLKELSDLLSSNEIAVFIKKNCTYSVIDRCQAEIVLGKKDKASALCLFLARVFGYINLRTS